MTHSGATCQIDTRPDSPLLKDLWALVTEYLDLASQYASHTLFGVLNHCSRWDKDAVFEASIATKNVDLFWRLLDGHRVLDAHKLICKYDQVTMFDAFRIRSGGRWLSEYERTHMMHVHAGSGIAYGFLLRTWLWLGSDEGRHVMHIYADSAFKYGSVRMLRCLRDEYKYNIITPIAVLSVVRRDQVAVFELWLEKPQQLQAISLNEPALDDNWLTISSPKMLECLLVGFPRERGLIIRDVFAHGTVPVARRLFEIMGQGATRREWLEFAEDNDPSMTEYLLGRGDTNEDAPAKQ